MALDEGSASPRRNDDGGPIEEHRFDISLNDLQSFLAVARAGSFSAAARRLNLSQPAVSGRIGRLEGRLGVKLFARTTREVRTTPEGRLLRDEAEASLTGLRLLLERFRADAEVRSRRVDVAATMAISTIILLPLLRRFHARHPAIAVRVEDCSPATALSAVRDGKCEIAVLGLYEPVDDLAFDELVTDRCVVAARPDHPVFDGKPVPFETLVAHPLLLPGANLPLRRLIEAEATRRGLTVRLVPEAENIRNVVTALAMAAAGLGVFLPPASLVPAEYRGIVATAPFADFEVRPRYGIVSLSTALSPSARRFADFLKATIPRGDAGWPDMAPTYS